MAQAPSFVHLFVVPLNRAGIEYLVTGALAAAGYGRPRFTDDIDLVLRLAPSEAAAFEALWPEPEFYCAPADVIAEESARAAHGHFNVVHNETGMRADVYLAGTDELNAWELARPVIRRVEGETVRFAPIEALIVKKLIYYRDGGSDRHLNDIASMLTLSGGAVDMPALDKWIAHFKLEREWEKARSTG